MPLVTLTTCKPLPRETKSAALDAIHAALVNVGVPPADRYQRVIELTAENVRIDGTYPDVAGARGDDFLLVEILWSVGRSVKVKRTLLGDLMGRLTATGIDTEQVMVVFKETTWENWSFAGGRLLNA
ncbi:MAG: tautomerase family protein [Burkholderiales bacterium]|nr:tautomerase family protein [Burkholderiales bacterium]